MILHGILEIVEQKAVNMIKNKNAVCFSLYNSGNDFNLYYFKSIILWLCLENKVADIYIDTTESCKKILDNIIVQEELDSTNVNFTIYNDNEQCMLWRLYRAFDISEKYEMILIQDSDFCDAKYEYILDKELPNYGLIIHCYKNRESKLQISWNKSYIPGNMCIKPKYLKMDINKYRYILNEFNSIFKNYITYGIDEWLHQYLFIYELLNNNVCHEIGFDDIYVPKYIQNYYFLKHHDKLKFKKLKYLDKNKNIYYINNIPYLWDNIKPKNKQKILDGCILTKYKSFMIDIIKYIFTDVDNFHLYHDV